VLSQQLDAQFGGSVGGLLYRAAQGWAQLPAGTSGQFLKTNGSGAAPSFAAAGGGMQYVSSTPTTSGSSVTISGLDATSTYHLFFKGVSSTNGGANVLFRVGYSAGSTDSTAVYTGWKWVSNTSGTIGGSSADSADSASSVIIATQDAAAGGLFAGWTTIQRLSSTALYLEGSSVPLNSNGAIHGTGGDPTWNVRGTYTGSQVMDAVVLVLSAGTFDAGSVLLFKTPNA
jgi:hypothetical protein